MAVDNKFIIGSRGSKLSLAYSNHVKNLLLKNNPKFKHHNVEIKIIKRTIIALYFISLDKIQFKLLNNINLFLFIYLSF